MQRTERKRWIDIRTLRRRKRLSTWRRNFRRRKSFGNMRRWRRRKECRAASWMKIRHLLTRRRRRPGSRLPYRTIHDDIGHLKVAATGSCVLREFGFVCVDALTQRFDSKNTEITEKRSGGRHRLKPVLLGCWNDCRRLLRERGLLRGVMR